jgi:alpha-glucosidase
MDRTRSATIARIGRLAASDSFAQSVSQQPSTRGAPAEVSDADWWKHAVIYEVYPRSFQDSNDDGIGDLNGITRRLDYLQTLGVDAIWISPMYPSPQIDFGYDVSDYENVDPQYGSLADLDRLVAQASKRQIRIVLDMVVNHTSDQHPWFTEAASARASPKHDWYVWSDGKLDATGRRVPPNNWVSLFGGSAWEWVPAVQQYYYHKFYKQQPDLNWRNPSVEKQMFDAMRFWLDRGIAGFRLDAVPTLFEDAQLRDEPAMEGLNAQGDPNLRHIYTNNLPEVHQTMRRLRAMIARYPGDRVLIGETYLPDTAELDKWYGGAKHDELQLPMDTLVGFTNKLDANVFRQRLSAAYTQLHGSQPLLVFDNHDNVRSWDRYGDGVHNVQIAKIIATLLLTSKATALLYQGQEIGLSTATPTHKEDVKDPIGITGWPKEKGRDGERTPMQWDVSNRQAGFSDNPKTWLPVQDNYLTVNVQSALAAPDSLLNWYRQLIAIRRTIPALHGGGVVMLDQHNPDVLSYARIDAGGKAVVVTLNMSATEQLVSLDLERGAIQGGRIRTLMASPSTMSTVQTSENIPLAPFAAWVGAIE